MILGSVGGGVVLGLTGATMTWFAGHPPVAIFGAYALVGCLGTLLMAVMTALHRDAL